MSGEFSTDTFVVDGRGVVSRWSCWCASWGVLVDTTDAAFCGLSFYVAPTNQETAAAFVAQCDPRLMRFATVNKRERYGSNWEDGKFIELVWRDAENLVCETEIVDEGSGGTWLYYDSDMDVNAQMQLYGYRLDDFGWILEGHRIGMPAL